MGLTASVVFFLAPLLAVLTDSVLGRNPNVTAHLVWALGFGLLAGALLAFDTPRWIARLGCFAAGASGLIFLVQGISDLVPNATLHRIAFPILGGIPERVLIDLLIVAFVGLLLTDSRGKSRVFGWLVMVPVVGLEVVGLVTQLLGNPLYEAVPALKLILLVPLVWLLCESVERSAGAEPPHPVGTHRKQ